jgi:hypothetical protein
VRVRLWLRLTPADRWVRWLPLRVAVLQQQQWELMLSLVLVLLLCGLGRGVRLVVLLVEVAGTTPRQAWPTVLASQTHLEWKVVAAVSWGRSQWMRLDVALDWRGLQLEVEVRLLLRTLIRQQQV